jgi:dolichol-phosphate mannosyltransferase
MPEQATTSVELPRRSHAPVRREQHATVSVPPRLHVRVRHGVLRPHNWLQLIRFGAVGATGYAVNLAVFALCVHVVGIDYRISAVIAWILSVLNNFWLNRHWTFRAKQARAVRQGVRFFAVSLVVFGFSYLVLIGLVEGLGMTKVLAQAIAVAAGTPLNFVGQKLWSFKIEA